MVIRKALYGLKSSGAAFWAHLAETLYDIGFRSSKADHDVWLRPAVKPNGPDLLRVYLVLCGRHPFCLTQWYFYSQVYTGQFQTQR